MDCYFPSLAKGTSCERCGWKLPQAFAEHPRRACEMPCANLGESVGVVLVQCRACKGRVTVKKPVFRCTAFGRCLPNYVPADLTEWQARKPESDIYHLCRGCESFAPLPPPAAPV